MILTLILLEKIINKIINKQKKTLLNQNKVNMQNEEIIFKLKKMKIIILIKNKKKKWKNILKKKKTFKMKIQKLNFDFPYL